MQLLWAHNQKSAPSTPGRNVLSWLLLAWQWREPREGMWKPDCGPPRQSRRKIAPFSLLLPRAQPCLQAGMPTSVTACLDSVSVLTFSQAEPGVSGAQPFSNWWAGEWLQPSWPWKCPTEVCHCHFSWEIAFGLSTFRVIILFQGETVPSTTGGRDGRPSLPWCVSPHLKAQLLGTLWRGAPQTGEVHRWEKNVAWKSGSYIILCCSRGQKCDPWAWV